MNSIFQIGEKIKLNKKNIIIIVSCCILLVVVGVAIIFRGNKFDKAARQAAETVLANEVKNVTWATVETEDLHYLYTMYNESKSEYLTEYYIKFMESDQPEDQWIKIRVYMSEKTLSVIDTEHAYFGADIYENLNPESPWIEDSDEIWVNVKASKKDKERAKKRIVEKEEYDKSIDIWKQLEKLESKIGTEYKEEYATEGYMQLNPMEDMSIKIENEDGDEYVYTGQLYYERDSMDFSKVYGVIWRDEDLGDDCLLSYLYLHEVFRNKLGEGVEYTTWSYSWKHNGYKILLQYHSDDKRFIQIRVTEDSSL